MTYGVFDEEEKKEFESLFHYSLTPLDVFHRHRIILTITALISPN